MTYAEILCLAVIEVGMPHAQYACDNMETVIEAAEKNDVRPELIISMIHYESNWNPNVISRANACGLTQVIPKFTGNKKVGTKKLTCKQLLNPRTSILTGTKILAYWMHKKYARKRAKEKLALCSYLDGYRCVRPPRSKAGLRYARKIQRYAKRIKKMTVFVEDCIRSRHDDEDEMYEETGCTC